MKISEIIKNNLKVVIIMSIVIVLSVAGITYSLLVSDFNPIGITTNTGNIGINLEYLNGSTSNIISNGLLMPIPDENEFYKDSPNAIKVEFKLSGKSTNPENTIYDIALHDIQMDCELKKSKFNWSLYKNDVNISSGTFSPNFDKTILEEDENGIIDRYVLTNIQQDLTTEEDTYALYLWITERCSSNYTLAECMNFTSIEQSNFSDKSFSATLKVEVSTKTKKEIVREGQDVDVCLTHYEKISAPSKCESHVYNGTEQIFINSGEQSGYKLINNTATNVGTYQIIASLNDGYTWTDGSKKDKIYTCNITPANVQVYAYDQSILYGNNIYKEGYGAAYLIEGHQLYSVNLYANRYERGKGLIIPSAAIIHDSEGNDVTDNYNIEYIEGVLLIS